MALLDDKVMMVVRATAGLNKVWSIADGFQIGPCDAKLYIKSFILCTERNGNSPNWLMGGMN